MICNMISTGSMILNGKVYQNLMVDVMQTNEKLVTRAENIIMAATDCTREVAAKARVESGGRVKVGIVMVLMGCTAEEAVVKLIKKANLRGGNDNISIAYLKKESGEL